MSKTLDQHRSDKAIDAFNAGYRSVERGHSGDEPRYLRFRTGNLAAFNEGRAEAEERREKIRLYAFGNLHI